MASNGSSPPCTTTSAAGNAPGARWFTMRAMSDNDSVGMFQHRSPEWEFHPNQDLPDSWNHDRIWNYPDRFLPADMCVPQLEPRFETLARANLRDLFSLTLDDILSISPYGIRTFVYHDGSASGRTVLMDADRWITQITNSKEDSPERETILCNIEFLPSSNVVDRLAESIYPDRLELLSDYLENMEMDELLSWFESILDAVEMEVPQEWFSSWLEEQRLSS